ncbi:hypothetical protein D3C76_559300 [compost metagenome]
MHFVGRHALKQFDAPAATGFGLIGHPKAQTFHDLRHIGIGRPRLVRQTFGHVHRVLEACRACQQPGVGLVE